MNNIKEDTSPLKVTVKSRKGFASAYIKPLLDGSFLSKEGSAKELPFMGFLLLLIIIFISNTFWAQGTVRKIDKYEQEVKELRIKSISVKAQLMNSSRQTLVAKKVKDMGLEESLLPPKKIFVEKEAN